MTKRVPSDFLAVIFCGGASVRMGPLATVQPKTLLPAYDERLLWRQIEQLRDAGCTPIVVSTTPRYELQIRQEIESRARSMGAESVSAVLGCAEQENGLLAGLRSIFQSKSAETVLLCLGDIFFRYNPFTSLQAHFEADYDCILAAPVIIPGELDRGGLILHRGDRVERVIEQPKGEVLDDALRWTGVALLNRRRALVGLDSFLATAPAGAPPGDFLDFQCRNGVVSRLVETPDFVNVNSPDDLLLASLYARLERETGQSSFSKELSRFARSFRHELASRSRDRSQT